MPRLPGTSPLEHWARKLDAFASANTARAIREGVVWLVPTLLLSALLLVLAVIGPRLGLSSPVTGSLMALHRALEQTIPALMAASIAYVLALRQHLPRLPIALLSLTQIVIASILLDGYSRVLPILLVVLAITVPLMLIPLISFLHRQFWMPRFRAGIVSDNLRDVLNLLVPSLLTTFGFIALVLALRSPLEQLFDYQIALPYASHPYLSGLLLSSLNSTLWFFGIHGYHALAPLFQTLDYAVTLNAADYFYNGQAQYILNASQMAAFVFIGGSGATLSLALCLVLFCRNGTLRLLGLAGLPLACLNVNEILLFGLPIILNPRLFIPFLLAPASNLVLSLGVISLGWVSPATISLPLNAPLILNAYWSTGGEIGAIVLQLSLVICGIWIYLPFVRRLDARISNPIVIAVRSLDTTFTRLHEEAVIYNFDTVAQANALRSLHAEENRRIREISEYAFSLAYQPQISLRTGQCQACEALLRARDPSGNSQAPLEFLNWLERVGLIKDLDLWVASRALAQQQQWQRENWSMPISINLTGHTLSDPEYRRRLVDILRPLGSHFIAEITESALAADVDGVSAGINALHAIGVSIAIDDFGTGYSSLSYLHQFAIDKIKIDRSFVQSASTARGQDLLDGLLALAERLKLEIVVEGVETEAQQSQLVSENDLLIQGWLYSPALPAEHFKAFAEARQGV